MSVYYVSVATPEQEKLIERVFFNYYKDTLAQGNQVFFEPY